MKVTRREAIGLGAIGAAIAGCAPIARQLAPDLPADLTPPDLDSNPLLRLVQRASFGPTPGELARVEKLGHEAYLEEQLVAQLPEPAHLTVQLYRLDALRMDAHEMEELPIELVLTQLQQAAILRAVYSPNQLRERMVEFWTDHFNIYARKGSAAFQKGTDDAAVIRRHALGKFPDLLLASAKSPAMLAYLDNQANARGIANENYARELMELHTLGVQGGYTQRDVQEVARCFTGWGLENRFLRAKGKFRFDPERHDFGAKQVLGRSIPEGGGISDGETVVQLLAHHPNTAEFICRKLSSYFLGHVEPATVADLAQTFRSSGGDIAATLRELLSPVKLAGARPIQKRPFDFLISALRSCGAATDGGPALQGHLADMGMPLYQWPMPDGYPTNPEAWTGTLLARWNFASSLASGGIRGTAVDLPKLEERSKGNLVPLILGSSKAAKRVLALTTNLDLAGKATATLASPEFQWR